MAGGFAAGFFGTLAEDIGDRQEYVRNRVEEKRDELRQRGLERMGEVNRQRRAYETAARSLMRMSGVNSDRIISALESDPDAIVDAYNRAQSNPNITGSVLNQFFSVYDSTPSSTSLSEAVNNILPMSADVAASRNDPTSAGTATLASLLGLDIDATLNSEVYDSDIVGGMTGAQITASMSQPVTARGTRQDGVQLDYSVFAPENLEGPDLLDIRDFRDFEGGVLDLYRSRADAKIRSLQAELESVDRSQMSPEQMAQRKAELQEQILRIDEMVTIDDFIQEFEPTILQDQLRLYPEAQRQQLMELYDMPGVPVAEPTVTDEVTTVTPEIPTEIPDTTPEAFEGDVTEEGTSTNLPDRTPEEDVTEEVTGGTSQVMTDLRRGLAAVLVNPDLEEVTIGGQPASRDSLLAGEFSFEGVDPVREVEEIKEIFDIYNAANRSIRVKLPTGRTILVESERDFDLLRRSLEGGLGSPQQAVGGIQPTGTENNAPEFYFVLGEDNPAEFVTQVEEEFDQGTEQVNLTVVVGGQPRNITVDREEFEQNKERILRM